jgi:DNA-binding PucR family transcriptional regulator
MVRRGVPLGPILRASRVGHAFVWERWARAVAEAIEPARLPDALELSARHIFRWTDVTVDRLTTEYETERTAQARSADATRASTARAILAGEPVDAGAASRALHYELQRNHVALVLWEEPGGDDEAFARLERAARDLGTAAGTGAPLTVPVGTSVLWAWIGSHDPFADEALEAVRQQHVAASIRVGVGEPGAGLAGFVRSHHEAIEAHRVAVLAERRGGSVTRYSAVELASLLSVDLERARHFVARELGALAGRDDGCARLRATLRVFFAEGSSNLHTGRRLGIHQNTVVYRIGRAEEMLGRRITERQLALEVALVVAQALGDAALPEPDPA